MKRGGALACLHALAGAGECEILATVSSTHGNASVGAVVDPAAPLGMACRYPDGKEYNITEKLSKAAVGRIIDGLIMRKPLNSGTSDR